MGEAYADSENGEWVDCGSAGGGFVGNGTYSRHWSLKYLIVAETTGDAAHALQTYFGGNWRVNSLDVQELALGENMALEKRIAILAELGLTTLRRGCKKGEVVMAGKKTDREGREKQMGLF